MDARGEELLRAIVANPDDDAARLAYAKHVEGEAPAHAALIASQCAGKNEPEVLAAFLDELPEALRRRVAPERGFCEPGRWHFEARDFVELDPDLLFRLAPGCTQVRLQDVTDVASIAERTRRFEELTIAASHLESGAVQVDASCMAHIRALRLESVLIDGDRFTSLLQAFPSLESVVLDARSECQSLLDTLRRAASAATLRELTLHRCKLDLRGFAALRKLWAQSCVLDASFAALPNQFQILSLTSCDPGDVGPALFTSHVLDRLRELELFSFTKQENQLLLLLLASPLLGPLRSLTFQEGDADKNDGLALVQGVGNVAATLERLDLTAKLRDDALLALAGTPFARLTALYLHTPVTPDAARAIAASPWVQRLQTFHFDASLLDEPEARVLAHALAEGCEVWLEGEAFQEVFDWFGLHSEEVGA